MPLLWISLSFLAGIALAASVPLPVWVWALIALSFLLLSLLLRRYFSNNSSSAAFQREAPLRHFPLSTFQTLLPIFLFLGSAYFQLRQPKIDAFHIAFYNDRDYEMLVTGTLAEPPDYRDTYTNLTIKVEAVDTGEGDLIASGLMLVRVSPNEEYEYGERIRLRGTLKTPPENEEFSYRDYLARQGIHSYMSSAEVTRLPGSGGNPFYRLVYQFKSHLLENTYRLFQDPEASLFAGILFGVDTGLPKRLQDAFKNTGTAHIIAISGFNIAIIAGLFFSFFRWMLKNERLGAVFAVLFVFLYAFLVGADPAVMRAAVMGSLSLFAKQVGRRNAGINTLAVVAVVMAILNPLVLWDVGFQLSFFATLGLILYAEPFSNYTANLISKISRQDNSTLVNILNDNVILTLAAQVMTIPLMAYYFQRFSLISFVANPFILPVQPAVMIVGGLSVFTSLILYPLGQFVAWIAWAFAGYTIRVVEFFDRVPNGVIVLGDVPLWTIYMTYITLLTLTFNWSAIQDWFKSAASAARTAALTALLALTFVCMMIFWNAASKSGDGQFHVTFLDAGSADAVLIQTPEGRNILINGGSSTADLSNELGRRLPFFTRKLDWLIIASPEEDQVAALPRIVERYVPENVLWSGNIQASFSARLLDEYFAQNEIPVTRAEGGQRLELGGGAFIEVQSAGPRGSVLLIEYGSFRALLPIGVSEGTFESLEFGNAIGKVDVLLLAESGYAPSNPPDIVENLNPQVVILSVAAGDPDGLPEQEVLDSLGGYALLRTDRNGWIDIITDGVEMKVNVERGEEQVEGTATSNEQ
ncbi:MAG: ComEC/Rec2 family competence protein [Anaerolineales bacterium]|nr:ComEC/Rec2 family competence protein [Anaerolineales bacterium]